MNSKAKAQMEQELKNSSSIAEMFVVLGKYYDLENCKPGQITKSTMIGSLQRGVMLVGAKPKSIYR